MNNQELARKIRKALLMDSSVLNNEEQDVEIIIALLNKERPEKEALRLDYAEWEKAEANVYKNEIILLLKPASVKVKYLVISSLFESFPMEYLFDMKEKKQGD
jgi:hypothetical protein